MTNKRSDRLPSRIRRDEVMHVPTAELAEGVNAPMLAEPELPEDTQGMKEIQGGHFDWHTSVRFRRALHGSYPRRHLQGSNVK